MIKEPFELPHGRSAKPEGSTCSQRGFVVILSMLFLFLLNLLAFSLLEQSLLEMKMARFFKEQIKGAESIAETCHFAENLFL